MSADVKQTNKVWGKCETCVYHTIGYKVVATKIRNCSFITNDYLFIRYRIAVERQYQHRFAIGRKSILRSIATSYFESMHSGIL